MGLYFRCNGMSAIAISKSSNTGAVVMARMIKPMTLLLLDLHESEIQYVASCITKELF